MTATLFLKPARAGLIVRDPGTGQPLPAEGRAVPDTPHWRRQRRFGDVVEAAPAAKAAPKASAKTAQAS